MSKVKVNVFWFRRDLRLEDNHGLYQSLQSNYPVLPLFIFDQNLLEHLPADDARVNFIYDSLANLNSELLSFGSSLIVKKNKPVTAFKDLLDQYDIQSLFFNEDYEPYALHRDHEIIQLLDKRHITSYAIKDQVIFHKNEICKPDGNPYTVYTPYKNKWLVEFQQQLPLSNFDIKPFGIHFLKNANVFPTKLQLGITENAIKVKPYKLDHIEHYQEIRNYPSQEGTSQVSPHLRFGTISIRKLVLWAYNHNKTFLSELIWREFFKQILFHFPLTVNANFKATYNGINWRNNEAEFALWCSGNTGYPMVDAGMRELNATGIMHNRVRMIVAGFLCKHLLIQWQWGEAYFAQKLLDYELSSNVGNWQWAAGTGCDAAPYFRVFNPAIQLQKFDKNQDYIKKWLPEYGTSNYPAPMVEHAFARDRAIATYKLGIRK